MSLALPARASLEYLKRLAKEHLIALRETDPAARLSRAQLAIARRYGFPSWRALKAEVDRRRTPHVAAFAQACTAGDVDALRRLLAEHPELARERISGGRTGLHLAARHAHALRLLIERGADPGARDEPDNASPLHLAAAGGSIDSVRVLLDAGADVHGAGDAHDSGVIGWAARPGNEAVVDLLLERGARHHLFSAMALGDRECVARIVAAHPESLARRRSRHECGQTPLHAAVAPPDGVIGAADHAMVQQLIDLGADVEATDDRGRTPLAVAMLRGDGESARLLRAAGAIAPVPPPGASAREAIGTAAASIRRCAPMFSVPDMRATVDWYESIGFTIAERYEDAGELVYARVSFGGAEFTLSPGGTDGPRDVSLWFFTDRVEALYDVFKQRQLGAAGSEPDTGQPDVRFDEDLYEPFYGGRQFSIRDRNGLALIFWQPTWLRAPT